MALHSAAEAEAIGKIGDGVLQRGLLDRVDIGLDALLEQLDRRRQLGERAAHGAWDRRRNIAVAARAHEIGDLLDRDHDRRHRIMHRREDYRGTGDHDTGENEERTRRRQARRPAKAVGEHEQGDHGRGRAGIDKRTDAQLCFEQSEYSVPPRGPVREAQETLAG